MKGGKEKLTKYIEGRKGGKEKLTKYIEGRKGVGDSLVNIWEGLSIMQFIEEVKGTVDVVSSHHIVSFIGWHVNFPLKINVWSWINEISLLV